MRHFNFNNSTKNAISRLSFAFSIIACILFSGTAWGQAKVTVESEISKSGSLSFEVWGVDDASVSATPVERTSPNGLQLYCAYDIDITKDGREWQPEPEQPAIVTMDGTNFADGQLVDIYHEGANGPEFVATVASENGKITFPAHSFSVYIVTATGDYARLKVNFHRASGPDVTIYVKKADIEHGDYETILYNPGLGTPADGVYCMGWMDYELYDQYDISSAITFDEIRAAIRERLDAGVRDGDELDFYAMLFKSYSVTYLAETDAVVYTDVIYYRADSNTTDLPCRVNAAYTPSANTQKFEGWRVNSHTDGTNILGHGDDDSRDYINNTTIRITGDVVFKVHISDGHWLIFKENGAGASFTVAQFIEFARTPSRPTDPTRFGYTFGGWYTDEACTAGNEFRFNSTLSENTTLYAKWTANTRANYTVIIWKQNVHDDKNAVDADKTYDFAESISLSGNVNSVINTITSDGSGDDRCASVNGTRKQYTGFHLNRYDQNVRVVTEGTSVVNIYYDRNLITLKFQYYNRRWRNYDTMTGLYGSTLSANGYIWPTDYWWYDEGFSDGSVSGTRTTFLSDFILSGGDNSETFYGSSAGSGNNTIHFLKQNDHGGYTEANTVTSSAGTFYISDKYNGYYAASYSTNNSTWTNLSGKDTDGYYGHVSGYTNLYIRFNRLTYNILYQDGVYVNGDNNPVEGYSSRGQLRVVENIPFESSLNSYNKGNANYYEPTFLGFVFAGWYIDDACTQPYTFSTMPEGITVYAKWIQIQYRVFLHPNAVDPLTTENDLTFDWPEGQSFNFRVNYGGNVQNPTANREDYKFVGWYTDEACTQVFDPDLISLTDETVTTPYDKTVDMTDPVDRWGDIVTSGAYNSDARGYNGGDRFWITRKLDLYGKWRAILRGAIGINVNYLANGGNNEPSDSKLYLDNAPAIAGHASSHATKEFSYWVLQRWNGSSFVDTDIHIYPGATFVVLKAYSIMDNAAWYNPTDPSNFVTTGDPTGVTAPDDIHTVFKATYTVQLRAEYEEKESPKYTSIDWFVNDGTTATVRRDETQPINETVTPPAPSRNGYIFKGWYKHHQDGGTLPESIDDCDPHFLYYNSSDGAFYRESSFTNVATIAADLYNPTDYMYAIWSPVPKFTFGSMCPGDQIELRTTTDDGVDLSRGTYSWTATYGNVYRDIYTASNVNDELTFRPDPITCASDTAFTITVKLPDVPNASDYDYIWKGNDVDWNTVSNWYFYDNGYSLATVLPDTGSDIFIGPATQCVTSNNWPEQDGDANAHNLHIADGATLTVPTGKILNVAGNLENIGTLDADEGKVVFCGPSNGGAQTISNDIVFGLVEFSNAGGNIVPSGSVAVNKKAVFTKGILTGDVTFNENSVAEVTNHNSFVAGTVTKLVGDLNEDDFVFPTGSHGGVQPDVLGSIKVKSLAKNSTTTVTFYQKSVQVADEGNGFSNLPRWWHIADMDPTNSPQLDHVSNFEYWKVNTDAALEATLTVNAADPRAHFGTPNEYDSEKIYSAMYMNGYWKNISSEHGSISGDHKTISVDAIIPRVSSRASEPSYLTLASTERTTLLPIELTSFSATCDGRSSYVMWTTATEKNNDYFSLERSDDAINFVEIARIAGAGNSIEPLSYSYTDYGVYGGDNYYRLVQVDYDGTRTASEIIVTNCVEASEEEPEVIAYPNPFSSDLTVELENFGDRPASIEVYDVLGRLVYVEKADAPQNSYQTILHLDGLSKSTYTVRVSTADFVINRKVVKD